MITYLIIIVTVGISYHGFSNSTFLQDWMHKPKLVKQNNDWKRLITSGFIHADWSHLIFNMLSLFFFGEDAERVFIIAFGPLGNIYFVLFYLVAIVVSSYPTQRKMQDSSGYSSLGASGAVSAVVFAAIMVNPTRGMFFMPGFIYAPLYLWYCNYMSRNGRDYINHDAHYYGAIFGVVAIVAIDPSLIGNFFSAIVNWSPFG